MNETVGLYSNKMNLIAWVVMVGRTRDKLG